MIVHCHAGISRSAAIVFWIHYFYNIPLPEKFEYITDLNVYVLQLLMNISFNSPFDVIKTYELETECFGKSVISIVELEELYQSYKEKI